MSDRLDRITARDVAGALFYYPGLIIAFMGAGLIWLSTIISGRPAP